MNYLKTLTTYIQLSFYTLKIGILSAMEFRTAFIMQVIGMCINNTAFIILWWIFFTKVTDLNGWNFTDMMLFMAQGMLMYGLIFTFCGNWDFSRLISRGELDQFLTAPKSVLWQTLSSRVLIPSLGDCLSGFIIYLIWGNTSIIGIIQFTAAVIFGFAIGLNCIIITQSLAFYVQHFEEAADRFLHLTLGFSLYPPEQFYGGVKLITMTILPAFFINVLPVELTRHFQWQTVGILLLFWLATTLVASVIFKQGLKRYESGNLIHVRL